jgi:hypothetical protein
MNSFVQKEISIGFILIDCFVGPVSFGDHNYVEKSADLSTTSSLERVGAHCDGATCDFRGATLYVDMFLNRGFDSEMENRYPGAVKFLSDLNRKQIVEIDDDIFLPPQANGQIPIASEEEYRKILQENVARFNGALSEYQDASRKQNTYSSYMKGTWRGRSQPNANAIESDGARERALQIIGHMKRDLGVTNPQVFNSMYASIRSADKADLARIKATQSTLKKVFYEAPIASIAIPVALWAAGGFAAGAGAKAVAGTGMFAPSAKVAALAAGVGASAAIVDDTLVQQAELHDGLRDKIDPMRTVKAGVAGSVVAPTLVAMPQLGVALGTFGAVDQSYEFGKNATDGHYVTAGMNLANAGLSVWAAGTSGKRNLALIHGSAPVAIQTQADLTSTLEQNPDAPTEAYVKDSPILGYRITSDRFEDIPAAIREHLGTVDQTKYTPEYLSQNKGSFIALQTKDGKSPDFYIVGLATKQAKYADVPLHEVLSKNVKLANAVKSVSGMTELLENDPNVTGYLKTVPVEMTRMSRIGYPLTKEISIESPWGTQTKPAGADAFITKNEKGLWYMVNANENGGPIAYVKIQH